MTGIEPGHVEDFYPGDSIDSDEEKLLGFFRHFHEINASKERIEGVVEQKIEYYIEHHDVDSMIGFFESILTPEFSQHESNPKNVRKICIGILRLADSPTVSKKVREGSKYVCRSILGF